MTTVLVIAVLGSIGLILGLDHLDPSFKTAGQLEHILQQPVLGTVPKVSSRLLKKSPMVVVEHPESTAAEAFRSLRATLSLFGREENRKLFLVTSALPFEGKSFVSVNLAAAFAQQGLRTLLIDADLRCPTIQAAVLGDKLPQQPGLADYLSGHIDIEDAMWQTSLDSLAVIPAGGRTPFPAELLGQPEFADMLAVMATLFDRVVIDSPPITPVSDSLLIAPHVHGICLVARASKSPRKSTEQALKLLLQVKGTVVGTVMNGVTDKGKASHYYKNYGLVAEPARTPVHTC